MFTLFEGFKKKYVVVNVDLFYDGVPVDFETLQVAVYLIIENDSKYIGPHTNPQISFRKDNGFQIVEMDMKSLHIKTDESDTILGKDSLVGKRFVLNSTGWNGFYRAKRFIERNGGTLVVHPGGEVEEYYCAFFLIIVLPFQFRFILNNV